MPNFVEELEQIANRAELFVFEPYQYIVFETYQYVVVAKRNNINNEFGKK